MESCGFVKRDKRGRRGGREEHLGEAKAWLALPKVGAPLDNAWKNTLILSDASASHLH